MGCCQTKLEPDPPGDDERPAETAPLTAVITPDDILITTPAADSPDLNRGQKTPLIARLEAEAEATEAQVRAEAEAAAAAEQAAAAAAEQAAAAAATAAERQKNEDALAFTEKPVRLKLRNKDGSFKHRRWFWVDAGRGTVHWGKSVKSAVGVRPAVVADCCLLPVACCLLTAACCLLCLLALARN